MLVVLVGVVVVVLLLLVVVVVVVWWVVDVLLLYMLSRRMLPAGLLGSAALRPCSFVNVFGVVLLLLLRRRARVCMCACARMQLDNLTLDCAELSGCLSLIQDSFVVRARAWGVLVSA